MKNKILIIGSNGQVGIACSNTFMNYEVETTTRSGKGSTFSLDLTDFDSIPTIIDSSKPDYIINAAAYTAVDKAESEESIANLINAKAPKVLSEICDKRRIPLLHFSTDYVYSGDGTAPFTEESEPLPHSVYAKTKLAGDEMVLAMKAPHFVLRTSWVFSPWGHNFVKTMLKLGADRAELSIVNDQIGSPTSAITLAEICLDIIKNMESKGTEWALENSGLYHATNDGYTSWADFAKTIFSIAQGRGTELKVESVKGIPTSEYPTPAKRPLNSRLSIEKLKTKIGFIPKTWDKALETEFFGQI